MKYIFPLFLLICMEVDVSPFQSPPAKYIDEVITSNQTTAKNAAFIILRNKCNVCHATKKRTDIFTLANMDSLAMDIHKQVLVKKKMPKGRKVKLTADEKNQLKVWLDETLSKNRKRGQ